MEHLPAIAAVVCAGAALHAATGFGFALVTAPVAFGLLEPERAIWLITLLGLLVNVMTLATEGRRPTPLRRDAALLLAWSVPGAVAGAFVLQSLDDVVLQAIVTAAVLGSLATRRARPRPVECRPNPAYRGLDDTRRAGPGWARPAAGVSSGLLNTTTGTGGPPLVLYLLHLGVRPERVRDTLTTAFLAMGALSAAVLALTGTEPLPAAGLVAGAVPAVIAGHLVGRRVFRRLAADGGYEVALVLVLLASAAGGLLRALG